MERHYNIISLIAVFFALGIGILVGTSMGENALIMNQIEVIERLREESQKTREAAEKLREEKATLRQELDDWKEVEESVLNPAFLEESLGGLKIAVVVERAIPAGLDELLEISGCTYAAVALTQNREGDKFYDFITSTTAPVGEPEEGAPLGTETEAGESYLQREEIVTMLLEEGWLQIAEGPAADRARRETASFDLSKAEIWLLVEPLDPAVAGGLERLFCEAMPVVILEEVKCGKTAESSTLNLKSWSDFKGRVQLVEKLKEITR